jgi:RNAPII transcription regulator C-terminal
VVALIINTIVREASVQQQSALFEDLFKVYLTGEPSRTASNQELVQLNFRPIDIDAKSPQAETIPAFVAAVAAARKEVLPPGTKLS